MAKTQIIVRSPYPTEHLCPASQRMARKSANRLSSSRIARQMRSVVRLLRAERQNKLRLGDLLITLVEKDGFRIIDIARAVKERANHLSEVYHIAKMFPPRFRHPHVPYTHYWMAMRAVRKFRQLRLDPLRTMAEIAANGFTQHRDVTRHFAAKLRERESHQALAGSSMACAGEWFNRCYHARFQTLLDVFSDASIKIIHADPPYANYRRVADGRYSGGSLTRTETDSATAAEAIAVTVDLLRDWGPKLKTGGVLLLWQAAGPLRSQIANAIEQYGWEMETVVVWDKGHIQAGNFEQPYSTQCEWLWVLKAKGDRLVNHDNSRRGDVLRFDPVHQAADTADHSHAFEKPVDLCQFLIGKHSYPRELVFDSFGCTGSLCVAAIRKSRHWVYAESNAINYRLGSGRIARELAVNQSMAS
jgi:DNA modification methylase